VVHKDRPLVARCGSSTLRAVDSLCHARPPSPAMEISQKLGRQLGAEQHRSIAPREVVAAVERPPLLEQAIVKWKAVRLTIGRPKI
jgi:hypothetical protein